MRSAGVLLQTQRGKQLGSSSSRGGSGPAPEARFVLSPRCRAGPAPAALRFSIRGEAGWYFRAGGCNVTLLQLARP